MRNTTNIGDGRRALVADDDPSTLANVADVLERLGFRVTRAADGDELLQHVAEHGPFELVVTDVAMPWMTGLHVAHSVRAAGDDTPVIVMTGLPVIPPSMATLGPNTHLLRKPFGGRQLRAAVERLVRIALHC